MCDLCRKIFRCFDFDANLNLDKFETKQFLEVFASEMNTIGTSLNRNKFKEWFAKIDADGSDNISLTELIQALCGILKVDVPSSNSINNEIPKPLIHRNSQVMHVIKK